MKTREPFWRAPLRLCFVMFLTLGTSIKHIFRKLLGLATPKRTGEAMQRWARRMLHGTGIKVKMQGIQHAEGCILVANHRSYMDIPVLMSAAPCTFLAKEPVKHWPVIGWAARLVQTVFVKRDCKTSRRAARQTLKERLEKGMSVMVFAEGTTAPQGALYPMKPGMFYLAAENKMPIVPVAIEYKDADDAWVGDDSFLGHFLRRFRQKSLYANVTFGPTIHGTDGAELKARTERWIRAELDTQLAQANA